MNKSFENSRDRGEKGCAVVLGATSPIAEAFARQAAHAGYSVFACARDGEAAAAIAEDVAVRSTKLTASASFDALDVDHHDALFRQAEEELGPVRLVLVAFGDMGAADDQQEPSTAEDEGFDASETAKVLGVNFTGAATASEAAASALLRGSKALNENDLTPTLIGIASVAGDRGRQSNYPYGAAKGGFALYLQGLRNRLFKRGVHVVTVKFGFIDTPMTFGMKTAIPIASPEAAAEAMMKAAAKGTNVLYFPWFWRWIMLIIRTIPETLFKRLSL